MKHLVAFTIGFIALLEASSLLAFFYPNTEIYFFGFVMIIVFAVATKRIEYGLYALFAELIVSSMGRMLEIGPVSLRMALFLLVLITWYIYRIGTFENLLDNARESLKHPVGWPIVALISIISISILQGIFSGYLLMDVFLDANGYIFLLIFFPAINIIRSSKQVNELIIVISVALSWLIVKSLIIFTWFTNIIQPYFDTWYYQWLRDTRVAELTPFGDTLVRVFLQSHIFAALGFLVILGLFVYVKRYKKTLFILLIGCASLILMSLSRSMWIGVGVGLFIILFSLFYNKRYADFYRIALLGLTSFAIGFAFLNILYYLPFSETNNQVPLYTLYTQRFSNVIHETAAASRWEQLPQLISSIKERPVFGHGLGKRLEIKGPNIKEFRVQFEWGWLDLWIKTGIIGVLFYLWFIFMVYIKIRPHGVGLASAIIALLVIHIFTPYLNHPLGIGSLVLAVTIFSHHHTRESVG